ncbi:MAG: 1-phosphofructokinase family hexose kinase [Balneolaceae bacterium]
MKRVLTITMNPSVDIGTVTEKVVTDQKTRCSAPDIDPGGGGINVARVLTRLDVHCDALFICGGYTGNLLKQMMAEEEIKAIPIESLDVTRQNIAIIDNSIREQYRFVLPGQVSDVNTWKEVLNRIRSTIHNYDYVVGSGSLPNGVPSDFYSKIGEITRKAGKLFILDTYGSALFNGLNSGVDYIKPNKEEFAELKKIFKSNSDMELFKTLFDKGIENIIYTLGKEKTLLINKDGIVEFTPPTIKVRSTIGAGDSFIGGLVAGLINDKTKNQAVGFGISAAASTLQSDGTDLCDADQVQEIYEQNFATV